MSKEIITRVRWTAKEVEIVIANLEVQLKLIQKDAIRRDSGALKVKITKKDFAQNVQDVLPNNRHRAIKGLYESLMQMAKLAKIHVPPIEFVDPRKALFTPINRKKPARVTSGTAPGSIMVTIEPIVYKRTEFKPTQLPYTEFEEDTFLPEDYTGWVKTAFGGVRLYEKGQKAKWPF